MAKTAQQLKQEQVAYDARGGDWHDPRDKLTSDGVKVQYSHLVSLVKTRHSGKTEILRQESEERAQLALRAMSGDQQAIDQIGAMELDRVNQIGGAALVFGGLVAAGFVASAVSQRSARKDREREEDRKVPRARVLSR